MAPLIVVMPDRRLQCAVADVSAAPPELDTPGCSSKPSFSGSLGGGAKWGGVGAAS